MTNLATPSVVKELTKKHHGYYDNHRVQKDSSVATNSLKTQLSLDSRLLCDAFRAVERVQSNRWRNQGWWNPTQQEITKGSLFFTLHVNGVDYNNQLADVLNKLNLTPTQAKVTSFEIIPGTSHSYYYHSRSDYLVQGTWRVLVTVPVGNVQTTGEGTTTIAAQTACILMSVPLAEALFGVTLAEADTVLKATLANGQSFTVSAAVQNALMGNSGDSPAVFAELNNTSNQNVVLSYYVNHNKSAKSQQALKGIQKTWKKVHTIAESVGKTDPRAYLAFRAFVSNAHRTVDKVRVSVVFNKTLGDVTTDEQFISAIKPLKSVNDFGRYGGFDNAIKEMPKYKEHRKGILKKQTKRAHSKLMQDVDFVDIDKDRFPLTHDYVMSGKIPLTTFFSKKEQYFLYNNNWELWEKMLALYPTEAVALAAEVSTRKQYDKDLMSYFYHVLYDLPEYLTKHTGRSWTVKPKLLNDSSALDSSSMANGVSKERSAMTPIVDNDAGIVTVPFVSVYMPGRFGVYCYAHNYMLLQRGTMHDGNAVMRDLEAKLNGKDDYGLMCYTLIGTDRGTGYPTFLIIFERLQTGTRVHIHRVNPSRSKDGDKAPIHDWTKNCYNWMAGNVRRDRIKTSQGDLMFVEIEDEVKREFSTTVNNFDSHSFDKAVAFCTDVPKSQKNLLGYAQLQADTWLRHPEHEDRLLKMGAYEIRQARSYENNPAGSWSLTID